MVRIVALNVPISFGSQCDLLYILPEIGIKMDKMGNYLSEQNRFLCQFRTGVNSCPPTVNIPFLILFGTSMDILQDP